MTKLQRQLSIALLVQVIAVSVVYLAPTPTGSEETSPLLEFSADAVTEIQIKQGPKPDQTSSPLVLKRVEGQWTLPAADGYVVDAEKVAQMLTKVTSISTDVVVARTIVNHGTLNVGKDRYSKSLVLTTPNGPRTLILGEAKGRSLYVRESSSDEVYLAQGVSVYDVGHEVTSYANPEYFAIDNPKNIRISRPTNNSKGDLELTKDEAGIWTVVGYEGQELDQSKVRIILSAVSSARFVRPAGKSVRPEFGFGNPKAKVSVEGENESIEFVVGAIDGELAFLKAADKDDTVLVRKYAIDPILNVTADRLLLKSPAAGTSTPQAPQMPSLPSGIR